MVRMTTASLRKWARESENATLKEHQTGVTIVYDTTGVKLMYSTGNQMQDSFVWQKVLCNQ